MSDVMVKIMLHGLMALAPAPGADGQVNHMTALLVDARQPRDVLCFVQHTPKITVTAEDLACDRIGCTPSAEKKCICNLALQDVTLTPDVEPPPGTTLKPHPINSLPFSNAKAVDIGYIANLSGDSLGQTLNPEFLARIPPNGLVARMRFPFETLHACSLATRRDEAGDNVHPLSFRPLGDQELEGEMSQALAQMLMAHYTLSAEGPSTPVLTLTLSDFGGANPRSLALTPGPDGYEITLENKRDKVSEPDDPCDDGVARDFSLLYNLALNPPPEEERKIPHVKFTRWKGAADLFNTACQGFKDPMSRPVCPIGIFNPAPEEEQ